MGRLCTAAGGVGTDDSRGLLRPHSSGHFTCSSLSIRSCRSRDHPETPRAPRSSRGRRSRRRAVLKSGDCNVVQSHVRHRGRRFLKDVFTTLVDARWRWTLLAFALSFVLSWLAFAAVWLVVALAHGDLEGAGEEEGWTPCVVNVRSFTSAFLFSVETQHSIGYGSRSTTEECPEAIFVMVLQAITGLLVEASMMGVVFAKLSRPKQRAQTLLFSKHAVVCLRDGGLCFAFRVGDMRKSRIVGAKVRALFISSKVTGEGELLPHYRTEMPVGIDGGDHNLFFIWPSLAVHHIDRRSPLYMLTAADLVDPTTEFEIVVVLEGTIESTGQVTQARSSYLPGEILWGHRFQPLTAYNEGLQGYEVDYSLFDRTCAVDTPLCSAAELDRIRSSGSSPADHYGKVFRNVCSPTVTFTLCSDEEGSEHNHAAEKGSTC
ncbi:ATP-sensitive inward rectifier potassium channel 11-like [Bacillus rossius redtenbacheri]|uniref:ATP-sensitive inward rectifier potassium channel 11-like n=1 Tax=Bacillus rossius redtenbacheri TaxID=93214 RepID=UPI002FDCB00F